MISFRNAVDPELAQRYRRAGWWGDLTLVDYLRRHVAERGDRAAFIGDDGTLTWRQLDRASDRVATVIAQLGLEPGTRIALSVPDSPTTHAAMLGLEKAGAVMVGVGARAGLRELAFIVASTGARTLVMTSHHREDSAADVHAKAGELGVEFDHVIELPYFEADLDAAIRVDGATVVEGPLPDIDARRIGPDDLSIINSTSGTTGRPKCVLHHQNRWMYFHQLTVDNGELSADDVFFAAVPAPFGFGLWTSHFSPIVLGCPTVVSKKFRTADALGAIERHGVTVLCCVSTQFLMILNEPTVDQFDLTSLRVMFTGGEAVPAARAALFEDITGCQVLQFYGSNETGVLSGTRTTDERWVRFETAGVLVPEMEVRLYDVEGHHQVAGPEGRPACRGPATCLGYLEQEANAQLYTPDGWMLMGDLCTIDEDRLLRVTGRTSDFIIRGGKNISAGQVEDEVATHPAVGLVAAVPRRDNIFGERVHVVIELRPGADPITLHDLTAHLRAQGTSVELLPESLEIVAELPRSSGAKVAKGELAGYVENLPPS